MTKSHQLLTDYARNGSEAVMLAEFRTKTINNNRVALTMNRKMMSPGSK